MLEGRGAGAQKQESDTQFKKAEEQLRKAITLKKDFSEARNNLAVVMIHFGRYDEAVDAGVETIVVNEDQLTVVKKC